MKSQSSGRNSQHL